LGSAGRALVVHEDQPIRGAVYPIHPAYDLKSLPLPGEAGFRLRDLGSGQSEALGSNRSLELRQVDLPPVDPASYPAHLQLPLRFLQGGLQVLQDALPDALAPPSVARGDLECPVVETTHEGGRLSLLRFA
jgi:hypothetical protein